MEGGDQVGGIRRVAQRGVNDRKQKGGGQRSQEGRDQSTAEKGSGNSEESLKSKKRKRLQEGRLFSKMNGKINREQRAAGVTGAFVICTLQFLPPKQGPVLMKINIKTFCKRYVSCLHIFICHRAFQWAVVYVAKWKRNSHQHSVGKHIVRRLFTHLTVKHFKCKTDTTGNLSGNGGSR